MNGRVRQGRVYSDGALGRRPTVPVTWDALVGRARRAMTTAGFAYVDGGAGSESTMRANRDAFDSWQLVPRVLRDVSRRDCATELFGRTIPAPVLLGPVGVASMAHPDGDVAVARAAAATGVPMVFSNQASRSMEECAAVMGDSPRWFQLYWSTVDELVTSFVARAEACGCEALVVTLDTTMLGWRGRDLDLGSLPFARGLGIAQYTSDPVFLRLAAQRPAEPRPRPTLGGLRTLLELSRAHPGRFRDTVRSPLPAAAVRTFLETYSRPSISWGDLAWLREQTSLPIVLKGVLHPDDARLALEHGADGLIVSTHGGRQVDGSVGALDALPAVVAAVGGRIPVLLDSGVRGGADVLKAVALGASAVLLGRPWVYGLAAGGFAGVVEVIENVLAELDLTLGLVGASTIAEAREITLVRRGELVPS